MSRFRRLAFEREVLVWEKRARGVGVSMILTSVRKNEYSGVQLGLKSHKHWKEKHSV
jgi:hypothetical protein